MTDTEVHAEVQPTSNSPSGQQRDLQEGLSGERESAYVASPPNTGQPEAEKLLSVATYALAPPCGDPVGCSFDCEDCSCLRIRWMGRSLLSMELQLQFLMSKADDLQDCLVNGLGHQEREELAAAVLSFLYICQPYFNHLESSCAVSQDTFLPFDYTKLLDFSQQLCDRLEQLVLICTSYSLLCLDETKPDSVSHFCIGQSRLGPLRVTTFRYCEPTPYLAQVDTGVYKRMRWNVERLRDEWQTESAGNIEYYFLCYEDIPNAHTDADSQGISHSEVVRMWSIGQWIQVNPEADDIYDWILCEVPQASYHRLLFLGSNEPSSCNATVYLQQLLLSYQTESC